MFKSSKQDDTHKDFTPIKITGNKRRAHSFYNDVSSQSRKIWFDNCYTYPRYHLATNGQQLIGQKCRWHSKSKSDREHRQQESFDDLWKNKEFEWESGTSIINTVLLQVQIIYIQ